MEYNSSSIKTEPKSCDEDSSRAKKGKASRGRCEPDAEYRPAKIPSELRAEQAFRPSKFRRIPTVNGKHMHVC